MRFLMQYSALHKIWFINHSLCRHSAPKLSPFRSGKGVRGRGSSPSRFKTSVNNDHFALGGNVVHNPAQHVYLNIISNLSTLFQRLDICLPGERRLPFLVLKERGKGH
jgi:hypothetical protein